MGKGISEIWTGVDREKLYGSLILSMEKLIFSANDSEQYIIFSVEKE